MKRVFTAAVLLSVAFSSPAAAQERMDDSRAARQERREAEREDERDDLLSPSLGAYATVYDGTDEPGWGAGGKVEFPVLEALKIEARGAWIDDVDVGSGSDLEVDVVPVDLGVALHLPGDLFDDIREALVRPYAVGGASWVYVDTPGEFDADDEWGWYAGGGFELGQEEGVGLLLEVIYRGVDLDVDGPIGDVDADLDGVTANAGLYYRW